MAALVQNVRLMAALAPNVRLMAALAPNVRLMAAGDGPPKEDTATEALLIRNNHTHRQTVTSPDNERQSTGVVCHASVIRGSQASLTEHSVSCLTAAVKSSNRS